MDANVYSAKNYSIDYALQFCKHFGLKYSLFVTEEDQIYLMGSAGFTHVLSLREPDHITETPEWLKNKNNHKRFGFDDVYIRQFYGKDNKEELVPATVEQVQNILDFGKQLIELSKTEEVRLLVHCAAGVSRSPAIAFCLIYQQLEPGQEFAALTVFKIVARFAYPQNNIIAIADKLLKRNGAMDEAMKRFKGETQKGSLFIP